MFRPTLRHLKSQLCARNTNQNTAEEGAFRGHGNIVLMLFRWRKCHRSALKSRLVLLSRRRARRCIRSFHSEHVIYAYWYGRCVQEDFLSNYQINLTVWCKKDTKLDPRSLVREIHATRLNLFACNFITSLPPFGIWRTIKKICLLQTRVIYC